MEEIAHPYAQAAFEYAKENGSVKEWQTALSALVGLVQQPIILRLLANPSYDKQTVVEVIVDLLKNQVIAPVKNFLRLLAENHRLMALPAIFRLFEECVAKADKRMNAVVISAIVLDENYKTKLVESLQRRFHQAVTCEFKVDTKLLGGVMVRMGDKVIDGSLSGKLGKLHQALLATI